MALKLATVYKGVDADYWKILEIQSNFRTSQTWVTIGLYRSEETRQESENYILDQKVFTIDGVDHTRATAYEELKVAEFNGATDL